MHLSFVDIYKKFANNDVILEYTKKIRLMTRIITFCMSINIICCIIYPFFNVIFFAKKKVLSFGFLLAFTDPKTDFGFYINFIFQQNCWIFGGFTYIAVFRTFWLLIGQIIVKNELLKTMIYDLKKLVEDNDNGNHNKNVSAKLSEIVDFHISYLKYIDDFEILAKKFFFVLASSTTIQVSITLLVLTLEVIFCVILKMFLLNSILIYIAKLVSWIFHNIRWDRSIDDYLCEWYFSRIKGGILFLLLCYI